MNASIQAIIDHMFRDTVDNAETRALHEELLNNCLEHYDDLVGRGMTEIEAIDAVVDSLKGMKEVIDEYPKKPGAGTDHVDSEPEKSHMDPETQEDKTEADTLKPELPSEYVYDSESVRRLRTDLKGCDLKIGLSQDQRIHVRCEDMEQLICRIDGSTLSVGIADKTRQSIEDAGRDFGNSDFSLKGLLSFLGKTIGSVASSITVSWDVYIDLPADTLAEMDLNSKSGDIEVKASLPEKLTARSMSGEIKIFTPNKKQASKVNISSMSGDILFEGNADVITVSSMSGDVETCGVFQEAELKSTSGDAELCGDAEQVRITSVSGDITVEMKTAAVRSIQARTTSGDADITLAPGTESVHTAMSTVSGSTLCAIPDSGTGARLQIQAASVSGDVTIR